MFKFEPHDNGSIPTSSEDRKKLYTGYRLSLQQQRRLLEAMLRYGKARPYTDKNGKSHTIWEPMEWSNRAKDIAPFADPTVARICHGEGYITWEMATRIGKVMELSEVELVELVLGEKVDRASFTRHFHPQAFLIGKGYKVKGESTRTLKRVTVELVRRYDPQNPWVQAEVAKRRSAPELEGDEAPTVPFNAGHAELAGDSSRARTAPTVPYTTDLLAHRAALHQSLATLSTYRDFLNATRNNIDFIADELLKEERRINALLGTSSTNAA